MWTDILIQAIGFIGIGLNLIVIQFNKHWQILLLKTLGSVLFVVQYILLKACLGSAIFTEIGAGIYADTIFTTERIAQKNKEYISEGNGYSDLYKDYKEKEKKLTEIYKI